MSYSIPLIHKAIYDPKLDLNRIRELISADCSHAAAVNRQNGYSPLHAAARRGDPALTKLLIDNGCFVDARTTIGQTPFLIACQIGNVRNVHVLAEGGADSMAADNSGKCALHYAAEVGSVPILHYLVEVLKHSTKVKDNQGNTALHYAVQERVTLSVSYLLRHKRCGIDEANSLGQTPVHLAAKNGSMKMVWELLSSTRSSEVLKMTDISGCTPEDLAIQGRNNTHRIVSKALSRWRRSPMLMRTVIPMLYWILFFIMPGTFMIIADLAFCYLNNPTWALIVGVVLAGAGFYFPVRPHRVPHISGFHNPAFMGAMLTEVSHTALCFILRIVPLLWPNNIFMLCLLALNSVTGLYILIKFKLSNPGFDKVGRLGNNGKPMTILDVAQQQHSLSHFELEEDMSTGTPTVLQFCDACEIVIPDRTKHCKLCKGCCNGFDHHCLWLTSCVGLSNHVLFVLFNLVLTLEGIIFLWGGVAGLSVALGEDFPWNFFKGDIFPIEKWIKFRMIITICTVMYTGRILLEQLSNISRLETTYFDLSGNAAYNRNRGESQFTWRVRLRLLYLFFTNYGQWYSLSCRGTTSLSQKHNSVV